MSIVKQEFGGGLQELASGSLPTLNSTSNGGVLQPTWNRSLPELLAANQALVNAGNTQPTAGAQALLGSTRTDFSALTHGVAKKIKSSENTTQSNESTAALALTLEERFSQHRDSILERCLRQERERSQRAFEKAVEDRRQKDWELERKWWMQELVGNRSFVDDSTVQGALPPSSTMGQARGERGLLTKSHSYRTSNLLPGFPSKKNQTLDTRLAVEHAKILQTDPSEWVTRLQQLSNDSGYTAAWQLLECMVPLLTTPTDGARGALIHLCHQYQALVKTRVASITIDRSNALAQNLTGLASTIADFCQFEKGSQSTIWQILYYCLRCGDLVAAREALGARVEEIPEQGLVLEFLTQLAQTQRDASCIWESTMSLPTYQQERMIDLYQKTLNLEPDNISKISVLALLSGQELSSTETIEDYLFGRLWQALQSENPPLAVEKIGASIRKYGPEYFGGTEENGGWGYALPLLVSQQFETSIAFLAQAGGASGLVQGTHLGLVLSKAGVELKDLGCAPSRSNLNTQLIIEYATCLENDPSLGVVAALEYLLRLSSKPQALDEIASLVFRSPHMVDQLCGVIKEDGSRQPGQLDGYLNREEVATVLMKSAKLFQQRADDRTKAQLAAKLYMLAGKYSSLLSLLNYLISPTDIDDEDKRYWWTESEQFYTHYLSQQSVALTTLENENNSKLITTNRILMELRLLFSTIRTEKYQEGFEMINRLGLLPFEQGQINEKESTYRDLDPIVKEQFPALLSAAIHCLHGMYRRIKSEAQGVNKSVDFHLKDLQNKARFLYLFSGLTPMPSRTKEEIQRLRNSMI